MGKKKPQKTKELSVAIAEASSTGDENQQPQQAQQVLTPRKRGRPRKVISEKEEMKEEKASEPIHGVINQSKKVKISEEEQNQQQQVEGKEEVKSDEKEVPRRRSSRRKSKPRKSS